jgi:hypothetical protein
VIKKTKLACLELSNEKSIPFYERLTSIVRFLYYKGGEVEEGSGEDMDEPGDIDNNDDEEGSP